VATLNYNVSWSVCLSMVTTAAHAIGFWVLGLLGSLGRWEWAILADLRGGDSLINLKSWAENGYREVLPLLPPLDDGQNSYEEEFKRPVGL